MRGQDAATVDVDLAWADLTHAGPPLDGGPGLSDVERRRLAGIAAPRRAAQFVAGRALARALLARRYGDEARHWTLTAREGEAPRVVGRAHMHLSLSHAGDLVACALAETPIGLDIEPLNPRRDRTALLDAIATPVERQRAVAALAGLSLPWVALHLWCLKEACLKLTGGTLFTSMLGHRIEALPAACHEANAVTWRRGDVVIALAADVSMARLRITGIDTAAAQHWRVRSTD